MDHPTRVWTEEISLIVASSGLPWRVSAAWVEHESSLYRADLTDTRSGRQCSVSVAPAEFPTLAARRAELTRQMNARARR